MIKLYNEDCQVCMKNFVMNETPQIFDALIIDLPDITEYMYKEKYPNEVYESAENRYFTWIKNTLAIASYCIKEGGAIIVICSKNWQTSIYNLMANECYWFFIDNIVLLNNSSRFNSNKLKNVYSNILWFSNNFNNDLTQEPLCYTMENGKQLKDIWDDVNTFNPNEKIYNLTQRPAKLFERIINMVTNKNDTILDCCMGTGTVAEVCRKLNRNYVGIEYNKKCYDIACKRLNYTEE